MPWLGLVLLAATQAAGAEDSMRCGSRLASTGDSKYRVLQLCGEPASVSVIGTLQQPRLFFFHGFGLRFLDPPFEFVPVEVWTYNFGPNKLLRRLRFEGDELVDIRADDYGF